MRATDDLSGARQPRLKLVFNQEKSAAPTREVEVAQTAVAEVARTSRSGRVIKAPAAFTPAPATASSGGKRRSGGKKTTINCAECGRGHSPRNNPIVFCDGCQSAWHKHCHDPQIPEAAITNLETEWKCNNCEPSQRRSAAKASAIKAKPVKTKPAKAMKTTPKVVAPIVAPKLEPESPGSTELAGNPFTTDEKRAWLSSLTHAALVDMLLAISTKNPSVPIFPANVRETLASKFAVPPVSSFQPSRARSSSPSRKRTNSESAAADDPAGHDHVRRFKRPRSAPGATAYRDTTPSRRWSVGDITKSTGSTYFFTTMDDGDILRVPKTMVMPAPRPWETGPLTDSSGDDIPFDDHRAYPKAGNGFALSSDCTDLDILKEDPESKTFSHGMRSPAKARKMVARK
ncbi:hypothetical protein PENDEC_c004G06212 [Penicillium decumbens]|uniref:PHD-type domain-containing protein n=1 Tax=Penicillium decumbens TaxID=69771 RepID=A0A1V6PGV7_PENDC|nr:hypothetical protein PENDEC_c004G06212 [Penicillium decumbens]